MYRPRSSEKIMPRPPDLPCFYLFAKASNSCVGHRGLDSIRIHSNSKKKPPTSIIPGDESRRWREGASRQRDAEIAPHLSSHLL